MLGANPRESFCALAKAFAKQAEWHCGPRPVLTTLKQCYHRATVCNVLGEHMQASPNSALLLFPLGGQSASFASLLDWWITYGNLIVSLSDDFPEAVPLLNGRFIQLTNETENLFFASSLLSHLHRTSTKRLYFLGLDVFGRMETTIRVAHSLSYDPVLFWDSKHFGPIAPSDYSRLARYCEPVRIEDFLQVVQNGWTDFSAEPVKISCFSSKG